MAATAKKQKKSPRGARVDAERRTQRPALQRAAPSSWGERLVKISDSERRRVGLADALSEDELPPPLVFSRLDAPALTGAAVSPINSVDELLDVAEAVVEGPTEPMEVERLVDGISRLALERCDDFAVRRDAILARLQWRLPHELEQLVRTWFAAELVGGTGAHQNMPSPGWIDELAERVRTGIVAPLLAAPTHAGGWIDPRTLVARMAELERARIAAQPLDFCQAVLRLAPEFRAEALEMAAGLASEVAPILRYALGADDGVAPDATRWPLWLCAARARDPSADLRASAFAALGVEDMPDWVTPVVWTAQVRPHLRTRGKVYLDVTHAPPSAKRVRLPMDGLFIAGPYGYQIGGPWRVRWVPFAWPQKKDAVFAVTARSIYQDVVKPREAPHLSLYFEPLLDADEPMTEMAFLATCAALCCRDPDTRAMGINVVVEGIGDGRIHPSQLADALRPLFVDGYAKSERIAGALAEVAPCSSLHRLTVAETIERLVVASRSLPKDVHHLFTILHDVRTELGSAISEPLRAHLRSQRSTGKTGQLARMLCDLASTDDSQIRKAVALALEARCSRAVRWASADATAM